jgi:MATE family multidrug resistance protein
VGGPLGVLFLAEGGLFGTVSLLMGRFGPVNVAAHQVAVQLASVTFTVCLGLGGATAARVGLAVGRGDAAGTRRAGFAGIGSAIVFMGVTAVGFALFARPLAALVAKPPEVVDAAVPLLHMAAIFQVFDGTQAVSAAALRGAADTRAAMVAGIIGHWGLGFGLSVSLAFGAGLGPVGLWWGLVLGLGATATFLGVRFERISRRRIAAVA